MDNRIKVKEVFVYNGEQFESLAAIQKQVENKIFKHLTTAMKNSSVRHSEMIPVMEYILEHKQELASLLSMDFTPEDKDGDS